MDSSFGSGSSYPSSQGSGQEMQMAAMQLQMHAQLQQATIKITDLCFKKCDVKPSTGFSRSERNCMDACPKSYMEASKFLVERQAKVAQQQQQH